MSAGSNITGVTAAQLRKAADIKDRIESLTTELSKLLEGTSRPSSARKARKSAPRKVAAKKRGGKRKISAEGRARIVAAQKKRWAAKKRKK